MYLRSHDPLPLGNERALGTEAVLPSAEALVTFERRDDAVVAASGTFGCALEAVRLG